MGRTIGAVAAGAVAWALLWNLGTLGAQAAFPETIDASRPLTHTGALLGYVAYSVVLSLLAGWITAAVRGGPAPMRAVGALAALQLALGIAFEISFWEMTPVWYHLVFLAAIVPATLAGGALRAGRSGAPPVPASR